jgi:biotin transporter BioY
MMELPTWFPWMIVGGISFMILNFVASKYNQRKHSTTMFAQDFVSGGILIALLGALVPDYFPKFPISASDVASMTLPTIPGVTGPTSDIDLQVGPLRR